MNVTVNVTLSQVLDLVGKLDDSEGKDTPRERLRGFLKDNVTEVGRVRDFVQTCLTTTGDQYNRSLQDLVNHLGYLLGFEVTFGRYQGVQGAVGFDGLWKSPTGLFIVIEVKTTEVYPIKTSTLLSYVNELVSEKKIPNQDRAMGLYVIGRPDPDIRQLENSILVEKRTNELRIVSVESLLSLAEMMSLYDVSHEDILTILRPSGPHIDHLVTLITNLVAQPEPETVAKETAPEIPEEGGAVYWLSPVKSDETMSAEEVIESLVGKEHAYAFGERTPGRKALKPGDWICFYATTIGVVAHARVKTRPEDKPHPKVRHPERYPWTFSLDDVKLYSDNPVVIDANLRTQLDYFKERDADNWAWFVQATRRISEHDFKLLTRERIMKSQ